MVDPTTLGSYHDVFPQRQRRRGESHRRQSAAGLGWPESSIIDLGDIAAAGGMEMFLPLWLRLYGVLGTGGFNIGIHR